MYVFIIETNGGGGGGTATADGTYEKFSNVPPPCEDSSLLIFLSEQVMVAGVEELGSA